MEAGVGGGVAGREIVRPVGDTTSWPRTSARALPASSRAATASTATWGLRRAMASAALSTLRRPTSGVPCSTCRWRFDRATVSSSTMARRADAGGGEVLQQRRAEPAGAHHQHARRLQPLLPRPADAVQDDVARVALDLGGAEHASHLVRRGAGGKAWRAAPPIRPRVEAAVSRAAVSSGSTRGAGRRRARRLSSPAPLRKDRHRASTVGPAPASHRGGRTNEPGFQAASRRSSASSSPIPAASTRPSS